MDRRRVDRRGSNENDVYVLDIKNLLNILWRRRLLASALLLLILVPGLLFVVKHPYSYTARSSVILEDQDFNLVDFTDVLPAVKFDDFSIDTQVKVLSSPSLIYQTLEKLDKTDVAGKDIEKASTKNPDQAARYKALQEFSQNLTVMAPGKSRVIQIAFKATDPYEAARVVNTHTKQYIEYQIATKKEQAELLDKWISEQVVNLRKQSQLKSQAIQDFRKEAGIVLGKNSEDLITQQITDIGTQLVPIETQKLNLQSRVDALNGGKGEISEIMSSNLINDLKSQISVESQNIKSLDSKYGKDYPELIAAKRKLTQLNSDLAREKNNVKSALSMDLEAATKQEALLRERLEELNKQGDELREKQVQLESLEAEALANNKLLDNFLDRSQEIKSQIDLNRADVRIVSLAEVPTEPSSTKKPFLMLIVGVFALIVSIGCVLMLELFDRGIEEGDDIKKILNFRLLGILPKTKNPLAEFNNKKRSAYVEELKRIYLTLSTRKPSQTILVTSSRPGEGKSTVALALASYLTSIRTKAILVDLDTANPSVAKLTHVNDKPGIADILGGANELTGAVFKDESGLSILPIGNQASYPIDLLSSDRLSLLMTALKAQYDYVIIDCASVHKTTDAEIIAGQVDQVLLVVEWAKTPKKILKNAAETLRQFSKDVPNVILNKHA